MKRHVSTAVVGVLLVAGVAACGPTTQTVSSTPDSKAAAKATKSAPKPSPTHPATTGDTITLKGQTGETIAVTLTKWADPARSGNEYFGPEAGKRWVAGQFRLKNIGAGVYDDSPSNGVQAADGAGQRYDATIADSITQGPLMPSELKLAKGDSALGWIVIEVPKGAKVTRVQLTLDSGFGDETGQWSLR